VCFDSVPHQSVQETQEQNMPRYYGDYEHYGDDECDPMDFANPGGNSALRAASKTNPRNLPCPNCGKKNRLTPADRALGYQCDECADRAERGCD
jgi:hypothetical protein